MKPRIAALFDAENIDCETAVSVVERLRSKGALQTATAVGDFALLKPWIDCARDNGIDLVLQPGLGKGKNSADIRLAIEAMDIVHRGRVEAIALITTDRDFTPLAFRVREAGIAVWGFGRIEPSPAFRAACNSFEVITSAVAPPVATPVARAIAKPVAKPIAKPVSDAILSAEEIATLKRIASAVCAGQAIVHSQLTAAVKLGAPQLAAKLKGRFLKTLVAQGVVERVSSGGTQKLRRAA